MLKSISLILPFFNEIAYIKITVPKAISVLDSIGLDYEIILVDDGSYDGSEKISDELSKSNYRIKVIHHNRNKKLGAALKTGFFYATKEIIIYTDIDMPFDLWILKDIISLMEEFDIIIGFKKSNKGPLKRIIYSKCYNFLIRAIFHMNLKDINFALKIFRRELLDKLNLKSEGSFINAEFLIKAISLNYKILEFSVDFIPRKYGRSKLSSPRVIIEIIYEMIKLYPHIFSFKDKS